MPKKSYGLILQCPDTGEELTIIEKFEDFKIPRVDNCTFPKQEIQDLFDLLSHCRVIMEEEEE
jgi:hypothetical protein